MDDAAAVQARQGSSELARRGLREVGHLACLSVTSAKPGNGVELLRDGRSDTFWQSDGLQPHVISLQFNRRMPLVEVHVHMDYKLDESYTPSKISVQAGSCVNDLKEIKTVDIEEPSGWIVIPLNASSLPVPLGSVALTDSALHVQPAFILQLAIVANHQNGRDTHVRGVRVYAQMGDPIQELLRTPVAVNTPEFRSYTLVR